MDQRSGREGRTVYHVVSSPRVSADPVTGWKDDCLPHHGEWRMRGGASAAGAACPDLHADRLFQYLGLVARWLESVNAAAGAVERGGFDEYLHRSAADGSLV